jgi:hypothetical protein
MQNLTNKSMYHLYRSCSAPHKETNKIGFTNFMIFLWISRGFTRYRQNTKGGRIYFQGRPWNDLNLHRNVLRHKILHKPVPGGGCELAAGDVGPRQVNKWVQVAIGLTLELLVVMARPEALPVSGGGGAVVVRPRELKIRRGEGLHRATRCGMSFKVSYGRGSMLWVTAKTTGAWSSPRRHQWWRGGSGARAGESTTRLK